MHIFKIQQSKGCCKKAILEAGTAVLKRFHQIKKEELKLHRRKSELKIDIEMAKAKAEKKTCMLILKSKKHLRAHSKPWGK